MGMTQQKDIIILFTYASNFIKETLLHLNSSINSNEEIDTVLAQVMNMDGAVICEFIGSITFDEIPKCISSLDESGNRVSALLENPFPFLSEQEMQEIYAEL